MTLRLLLIRHGLSSFNIEKRIQGRNDLSVLTSEGQKQAQEIGSSLSELDIHAIYSSPLKRASSTTDFLIKRLRKQPKKTLHEGLLEVDLAPWSGLTINEVKKKFPDEYLLWQTAPKELTLIRDNEEKYKPILELRNQAKYFLEELIKNHPLKNNETVILVGHNAILRCIILYLIGEPNQGFRRIKLDNASISVINIVKENEIGLNVQIECLNNTTHLSKRLPKKSDSARLILVRHGETDWNLQGRFQGQIDIPLNKNGKNQALAAGDFLREEKIDVAYSSSLSRPLETTKLILNEHPDVKITLMNDLIEIGHGLWEGKLESEIKDKWAKMLSDWKEKPDRVNMPEGESIQEVWERSVKCWKKICSSLSSKQVALVVAHDAVNKTIICHLLGLESSNIWMVKQGN